MVTDAWHGFVHVTVYSSSTSRTCLLCVSRRIAECEYFKQELQSCFWGKLAVASHVIQTPQAAPPLSFESSLRKPSLWRECSRRFLNERRLCSRCRGSGKASEATPECSSNGMSPCVVVTFMIWNIPLTGRLAWTSGISVDRPCMYGAVCRECSATSKKATDTITRGDAWSGNRPLARAGHDV
jgi:hypothetical protein